MISVNYKYLTLFIVALAIYLLWMDVSLQVFSEVTKKTELFVKNDEIKFSVFTNQDHDTKE